MCFEAGPDPGNPKIGRPRKSLDFEIGVGGPAGHPQGVQVKSQNIKNRPKDHYVFSQHLLQTPNDPKKQAEPD